MAQLSSELATSNSDLDIETLQEAISDEYRFVAEHPLEDFHFHTGRPLAALKIVRSPFESLSSNCRISSQLLAWIRSGPADLPCSGRTEYLPLVVSPSNHEPKGTHLHPSVALHRSMKTRKLDYPEDWVANLPLEALGKGATCNRSPSYEVAGELAIRSRQE